MASTFRHELNQTPIGNTFCDMGICLLSGLQALDSRATAMMSGTKLGVKNPSLGPDVTDSP